MLKKREHITRKFFFIYNRQNEKYTYLKRKVHFLHNSLMKNLSDSLSDHRF